MNAYEALAELVAAQDGLRAAEQQWRDSMPQVYPDPRVSDAAQSLRAAKAKARTVLAQPFIPHTTALGDVLAERKRQVDVEGYDIDRAEAEVYARGGFVGTVMTRADGWISEDGGLSYRDPAPNAANPAMPRSPIVTVTVGTPSASSTVDPSGVLRPPARDPHRGGHSYEASMLRNLLARIHGDGGHYVEEHGLEKALADADAMASTWRLRERLEAPADERFAVKVLVRDGDPEAELLNAIEQLLRAFFQRGLDYPRMHAVVRFVSDRMESK